MNVPIGNIVITGGSGFIGRSLSQRLRERWPTAGIIHGLSSLDVDLTDRPATFRWFEQFGAKGPITHIFHLAAVYKAGGWPATHPATQFDANMALNINLLEAWRRYCPTARLTSVVSYCMYPDHERPHPESELYGTEPEAYLYAYAFTKKALIIGQRAYCQEFNLSASSAVLPTVYGPNDSFAEGSHVMGALIGKFCRAVKGHHDTVEVWGDGLQEREFIHVEDAADGIIATAIKATSPFLNLGTGHGIAIRRIAEIIRKESGFSGEVVYNPQRFVGARSRVLCSDLAKKEIDWLPRIDIETGIRSTIAYYFDKVCANE